MKRYNNPAKEEWARILERPVINMDELTGKVQAILREIQNEGEKAVRRYTEQFDGTCLDELAVNQDEIAKAAQQVDATLKRAIEKAGENIRKFHELQSRK